MGTVQFIPDDLNNATATANRMEIFPALRLTIKEGRMHLS